MCACVLKRDQHIPDLGTRWTPSHTRSSSVTSKEDVLLTDCRGDRVSPQSRSGRGVCRQSNPGRSPLLSTLTELIRINTQVIVVQLQ